MSKERKAVVLMSGDGTPMEVIVSTNPSEIVDRIDNELGADFAIMEIVPIQTATDVIEWARDHGINDVPAQIEGRAMVDVTITTQALEIITQQQCLSLVRLSERENVHHIHANKGGVIAPERHITFRIDWKDDKSPEYGSIAPDGPVKL